MDSDNGLCKSSLQRYRDRGNDYEDAEELFAAVEDDERLPGQLNIVMQGAHVTAETRRVPNQSYMMVFSYTKGSKRITHVGRVARHGPRDRVRGGRPRRPRRHVKGKVSGDDGHHPNHAVGPQGAWSSRDEKHAAQKAKTAKQQAHEKKR